MEQSPDLLRSVTARLRAAGFLDASDEAGELIAAARAGAVLEALVCRRELGEPLAWLTGRVEFCGIVLAIGSGVYVPRPQSEALACRAGALLAERGRGARALDLCTGMGALAASMQVAAPHATVVGLDIDPVALGFARRNGIAVVLADAAAVPLFSSSLDVVTAVAPYVPTSALAFLPADTLRYEPRRALDGGADGLEFVSLAVAEAARLLRRGGALLLELGADQDELIEPVLAHHGFGETDSIHDDEGDLRGLLTLAGARN